ncbi:exodeoxyribonuclease VII large subunit [soil metagenome]
MSWDLFSSSPEGRQESLARRVAAAQADGGFTAASRGKEDWTVSELNAAVRESVESLFPVVRVVGEVTGFIRARSGHCYFSLRDADSQIRCVMWRDEARRLPTSPEEGMEVRALGRISFYPARGELQLVVSSMEAKGEGLWKLAVERLRAKLEAEGLTAAGRKRPLPRYPSTIGVVTSASGAVLHDIINVVRRRAPWTRIVLCGCRVQGEGAAAEIAAAIEQFGRSGIADVLIVGRGGGSVEDLWAFNEEIVARAIAASPIPVVSAVGHETDVTISDLVADFRAPTPSAAAEAAVPDGGAIRRDLRSSAERMEACIKQRVDVRRDALSRAGEEMEGCAERFVAVRREQLRSAARHLGALSPLASLTRGFAVPLSPDGRLLRTISDFSPGAPFQLRVADGLVGCRVEESHGPDGQVSQ